MIDGVRGTRAIEGDKANKYLEVINTFLLIRKIKYFDAVKIQEIYLKFSSLPTKLKNGWDAY